MDRFYYLFVTEESYDLRSSDLEGRNDSTVATIPTSLLDPGPDFHPGAFVNGLACDAGHDYAYVLANYTNEDGGGFTKTRILRIALNSGDMDVLSETDPGESPTWIGWKMALTDDSLITMTVFGDEQPRPLTRVDLADGTRTVLAPGVEVVDGLAIAPALEEGLVYVATFDGIDEIDLAGSRRRSISEVQSDNPLIVAEISSAAYDAASRRVIVGDGGLDMLIGVDVDTGERSEMLSRSVGEGPRMVAPRAMVLTQDRTKAYVADAGGNAPAKLFEIDLATGDRRLISGIDQQFENFTSGVAVDEHARLAYVSFSETILQVHIDTGDTVVIAGRAIPDNQFQSISGLLLDREDQRLMVADAALEAIIYVDVATREQTVFSQATVSGEGPTFDNINSLTMVAATSSLYVSNQGGENIMRVDLATGDRQVVLRECLDDSSENVLGTDETLQQVLYNEQDDEVLIMGDHLLSYDLETSACSVVFPWITSRGSFTFR